MASVSRKAAPRPAKPAQRYFAKKGPTARGDDGSSEEEQEQAVIEQASEEEIGTFDQEVDAQSFVYANKQPGKAARTVKVALGNVEVKDGRVFVDGQAESGKTIVEQQKEEESSESESEEEEESSEEESESEEEVQRPQIRPVFVSKTARNTLKERDELAFDTEEATKKREAAAEERKRQSRGMVGETIKRGMAEKEVQAPGKEIDDTDGKDPEEEFEAWRMRELMRLKRDKEAERQREEERLEIERRRAMPEEQRLKEDLERAQKLRDEKPKGNGVFLQKYWHKGAFYQDAEELKRTDLSGATESQVDVSLLPKIMQVKNFGKRSRTKYTHLKDEDTTMASPTKDGGKPSLTPADGQGCFLCGGPHLKRDCPQLSGPPGQSVPKTGTNAATLSSNRKWGDNSKDQSDWRDRPTTTHDRDRDHRSDRRHDERRDRDRDTRHAPSYSRRSRSPPPRRRSHSRSGGDRRHSRSPPSRPRHNDRSPKRRRLD